jgi:hypothetical protein
MDLKQIVETAKTDFLVDNPEKDQVFNEVVNNPDLKKALFALVGIQGLTFKEAVQDAANEVTGGIKHLPSLSQAHSVMDKVVTVDTLNETLVFVWLGVLIGKAIEQTNSLSKLVPETQPVEVPSTNSSAYD